MNRFGFDLCFSQDLGQLVGAMLGTGEDEGSAHVTAVEEEFQQGWLVLAFNEIDVLGDRLSGGRLWCGFDLRRIVKHGICKASNLGRDRGREEEGLAFLGDEADHPTDVVDEPHIEHAIGFVEDQHFDLAQVDKALIDQVEQSAGRRHQDVDAVSQGGDLLALADSAIDHGVAEVEVPTVGVETFKDLARELASRAQDECSGESSSHSLSAVLAISAGCGLHGRRVFRETMKDRQGKSTGLTSSGLGAAKDVSALHGLGDGVCLDWRRCLVTVVGDRANDRL